MANSFTYNGVDASTLGVTITQHPGRMFAADPRQEEIALGTVDGALIDTLARKPKYLQFVCHIQAATPDLLTTNMDTLMALLDPIGGPKLLLLDHEQYTTTALSRGYYAVMNGPVNANVYPGKSAASFQLFFVAPDGCAYAATETTQTITVSASPKTFTVPAGVGSPVTYPIVGGTLDAYATWVLKNTTGASATVNLLSNTTAEQIDVTIPTGAWVRLTRGGAAYTVEKSADSGATYTGWISGVGTNNRIPMLRHGVSNSFVLTGLAAGSVVVSYRLRFH